MQSLGAVFTALISFLLLAVLGRVFGPAEFGEYIALLSVAVLGLVLIEGGWPIRIYRESVDVRNAAAAPPSLHVAHAVAYALGVGLLLALFGAVVAGTAMAVAFCCMSLVALCNLASARMRGCGRFTLEALWQGATRTLSAALILLVVLQMARTPTGAFGAWAGALALLLLLGGRHWLAWPATRGLVSSSKAALPFLAIDGCTVFLLRGDMAILGAMGLPAEELSYYAAGTRFVEAAVLLFAAVPNVLLRVLRMLVDDPVRFRRALYAASALGLLLGVLATSGSAVAGETVMVVAFGEDYRPAAALLPYVSASLPLMLLNAVMIQALAARGQEAAAARTLLAGCALLATALLVGASSVGAVGAAVGAVVAHATLSLALLSKVAHRRRGTLE